MSKRSAEALLVLALGLRGSSLLFSKVAMESMGPFTLLGIRFLISFAVIALIFNKKMRGITKSTILKGMAIGAGFFVTMTFELNGLQTTPSSTTAFLENSAVVIIPLMAAAVRHYKPQTTALISAAIALTGVGFLTLKGSHLYFTHGELLVLGSAFGYAITVLITDKATEDEDAFQLGVLQLFFIGAFGMIAAFIFEQPALPSTAVEWRAILYLALVCSGVGFTVQPLAQKYTTPERTGLFTALNPLVAAFLGVVFLHESFGAASFIGGGLILFSIFYSSAVEAGVFKRK